MKIMAKKPTSEAPSAAQGSAPPKPAAPPGGPKSSPGGPKAAPPGGKKAAPPKAPHAGGKKVAAAAAAAPPIAPKMLLRPSQQAQQQQQPSSSSSSSSTARPLPPLTPRKLLDANFALTPDEVMPQLLEQHDFTVVGVLGFQGVGKSRLMSLLAGAGWAEEPAPDRADATTAPPPAGALHDPPFAPQTRETVLRGAHQTTGVEVLATSERLILLDTQPLLSPSALVELLGSRGGSGAPLPPDVQSHENLLELQSLRLALFVLSVCHVVIFVHDQPLDARWCRFVRAAHMLRHQLPDLSTVAGAARGAAAAATAAAAAAASAAAAAAAAGGEKPAAALAGLPAEAAPVLTYAPTVAIALTRAPLAAFGSRPKLRRALGQLLHAPAQPPTAAEAAAAAVAVADGAADDEPAAGQPLLFLLPPPEHEAVTSQHLGYRAECEALRDRLLSSRRRPFAKPLSEREWLRGACRIWELIIASPRLAEYNRAQQKLHSYS